MNVDYTDITAMVTDFMILLFMISIIAFMLIFLIKDAELQHAQHHLTRQVNVQSKAAEKTGLGNTLDYGEPFTVTKSTTYNLLGTNINLTESRTGVNRGQFTTVGYVYR